MTDDRLRVSVEKSYAESVGLAVFCFAGLEWNVVWSCERLSPGIINSLADETAGSIAKQFTKLIAAVIDPHVNNRLSPLASRFEELVKVRNGLVHAIPATDTDGGQRIFRNGVPWTIETMNKAADDFTACSIELNGSCTPRAPEWAEMSVSGVTRTVRSFRNPRSGTYRGFDRFRVE